MKRTILGLLVAVLLITSGCDLSQAAAGENDRTIKIAVMDSSVVFSSDDSYLNGIAMAIEDLNTLYGDMGYEISYEFYDDGAFFQQGIGVLNDIVSDPEITAVVGTSSLNILDVTADVLDSAEKLLITYYSSSDSLFENGYTHVFRNCFGENDLGAAIAAYASENPDMKRIAIYHSDTSYERGMVRAFLRGTQETDLQVVDITVSTSLESELNETLERWRQLDVDTVFVRQYDAYYAFDILQRVRGMDPDMNILGDFSFDYTDDLVANAGISDNIYIAGPVPIEPSAELDDFYQRYEEKFSSEPTQWAVQLYDSVRMVVDTAVRIGSTDPTDIAEALRNDGGYNGVSGTITFDEKGKLTGRAPRIMVSQNGAFTFMEE